MSADAPRVVVLGTMEFAGYVLTVVTETHAEALAALRAEYDRAIAQPQFGNVVPAGEDPLEWFGAYVRPMVLGKLEWQ